LAIPQSFPAPFGECVTPALPRTLLAIEPAFTGSLEELLVDHPVSLMERAVALVDGQVSVR